MVDTSGSGANGYSGLQSDLDKLAEAAKRQILEAAKETAKGIGEATSMAERLRLLREDRASREYAKQVFKTQADELSAQAPGGASGA